MRIWNKIWGKIQEQTKVDSIIYDLERKLIDIPSLLNCTIIDICLLTEEKKDLLINQINQALQETENLLVNLKTNLEQTSDNNTKKQLEYDIKNQENQKAKYSQIKEILNNQELQMHYLINYQAKINASHFFENNELIDIFEQFHLSLDFEPNDLILA
jgi:phenylalanyl-tRNA synthetase alpha subunit